MPAVHNRVMLTVAYFQAYGNDLDTARGMVLNELWHQVRESGLAEDTLLWPTPASMGSEWPGACGPPTRSPRPMFDA